MLSVSLREEQSGKAEINDTIRSSSMTGVEECTHSGRGCRGSCGIIGC